MTAPKTILVATDFGEAADSALAYGRTIAHAFGATLHVLHVTENAFMRAIAADPHVLQAAALTRLHQRLTDDDRRTLRTRLVVETSDSAAEAIVSYARTAGIDLIIAGTHGRGGMAHALMGSVAEQVVRTAPCAVLTVKHPERDFVRRENAGQAATA
jgi:nucleotide-binding universal stress UspA family protein